MSNLCKCAFRVRVLGDGCRHCQPQTYIDSLHDIIDEDRKEIEELEKQVESLQREQNKLDTEKNLCNNPSIVQTKEK